MKIWVVYFRGEREYASNSYKDAEERALFLLAHYDGEIKIEKEEWA